MKKTHYLILSLALLAFSCKKVEPIPPPSPDAADMIEFIQSNMDNARQVFTVDANSAIYITGVKGTKLFLPANSLVNGAGDLVSGNVQVELIEIDKKSEMVFMNKATMGLRADGKHSTLVSGGEFFVRITQDGLELTLTSSLLLTSPTETWDPSMRKFINISDEERLLWEIADDSLLDEGEDSVGMITMLNLLPGEWGWTNIDRWYSDPRPKTTIYAEVPEGFDDTNTEVFISYDGEPGALAQFDVWEDGRFTEHYGLIPIGLEVHFIAVGIVEDELHYSIQSATITADHVQVIDDFAATSEDSLIDLIDALP